MMTVPALTALLFGTLNIAVHFAVMLRTHLQAEKLCWLPIQLDIYEKRLGRTSKLLRLYRKGDKFQVVIFLVPYIMPVDLTICLHR